MSDSVRPNRRQPTRLLRPWDFPGKSTGVGCRCLLQTRTLRQLYFIFGRTVQYVGLPQLAMEPVLPAVETEWTTGHQGSSGQLFLLVDYFNENPKRWYSSQGPNTFVEKLKIVPKISSMEYACLNLPHPVRSPLCFPLGMHNDLLISSVLQLFLDIFFFKKITLGLCCRARAFSSWGEQWLIFIVMYRLLNVVTSLVAEHRLEAQGPQ